MAARDDDLRTTDSVLDRYHVSAKPIADIVIFHRHAFSLRHDCFEFSKIKNHVRTIEPPHGAAYDFSSAILELLINHFFFDLTDALHHCLLRSLCSDASKIARCDFDLDDVAHFRVRLDLARFGELDLILWIAHMINYQQIRERADFAGLWFDLTLRAQCPTSQRSNEFAHASFVDCALRVGCGLSSGAWFSRDQRRRGATDFSGDPNA